MNEHDPLGIDAETMRELGYRTVDMLVERLAMVDDLPALRTAPREELEALLGEPAPETPQAFDDIMEDVRTKVLAYVGHWDHPRFFGYVPGSGTWPAALGDFIAAALTIDAGEWREGAGPSQVELTVLDWFKEWVGYPKEAAGILVSGGSVANMQGIAVAREALLGPMADDVVLYVGDLAHSSVARAARALGFRPDQVRILPSDHAFRLRPETVAAAMEADRAVGRRPLIVVAAGGATSTGSVDPLHELGALAREQGVWLHVDAAYGGFATLTERGRAALDGLAEADSVTLDPHKWLYMPFEVGCLLVREGRLLRSAFEIVPEYLKDSFGDSREVNFANLGLQLSRAARGIKVWMALKYFGVGAFRQAVDQSIDLAQLAQELIEASSALELVTPRSLGVVTFRRRFPGVEDEDELEARNAEVIRLLADSGVGLISSTRIRGRYVLRMCVMNHTSGPEDVRRVVSWIEQADVGDPGGTRPAARASDVGMGQGWLTDRLDRSALRAIPVFRDLSDDEAERVLAASREERVRAGDEIVHQWAHGKLFYVLLEGTAEVRHDGAFLRALVPGEFFGENAALDWGAGFSYPRVASVAAAVPCRLLAVPGTVIDELFHTVPDVERQIRAAMRERLPTV